MDLNRAGWIYLSFINSPDHFSYGDGERIIIERTHRIINGDNSNNSHLSFPAHFGTHIDFPYHFSDSGRNGSSYLPEFFISEKVQLSCICLDLIKNHLISPCNFISSGLNENTEVLIIKTGMENYINSEAYWRSNPGLSPELASYLKIKMPNLRIIGIDSISLTARQQREVGLLAHNEFLLKQGILIVEDMDLSLLTPLTKIDQIIISPFLFESSDGTPVTVFAKINGG